MSNKKFRIFDKKNPKALSEWERINAAIMDDGGKRKMTTQDVDRFVEIVPEHNSNRFSDETIIAENGGQQHWKPLGEYKPTCSYMPTWTMDDPGDKKSLYWPYIPNDDELMEEIYRDRPGARKLVAEHKKTAGWEVRQQSEKQYQRKEGF